VIIEREALFQKKAPCERIKLLVNGYMEPGNPQKLIKNLTGFFTRPDPCLKV